MGDLDIEREKLLNELAINFWSDISLSSGINCGANISLMTFQVALILLLDFKMILF
jgi:hypothetical protein